MAIICKAKQPEIGINDLEYMIMCFVWEEEKMSLGAIHTMQKLLIDWNKYAQWTENTDLLFVCTHLAGILKAADESKYKARKELYKQNKVDWRKVYNIPGARSLEDIMKAQEMYKQYQREHPDTEGLL